MRKGWIAVLIIAGGSVLQPACEVPPLMAPGSSIALFANPPFIVANGGVSVITALLVEPAGTLVPDGTVVFFFSNLGRVDSEGKTRDGVARVNLVADARSGTATVTAFSGGAAPVPTGTATGGGGASVSVVIGSANPTRVVLAAPASVRAGSSATIIANVFDTNGNPVANIPVVFRLSTGTQVFLESGGGQRFTDTNGQAFDELITRLTSTGPITVNATTANGVTATATIAVTP